MYISLTLAAKKLGNRSQLASILTTSIKLSFFSTRRKNIQREKTNRFAARQKDNQNLPDFKSLIWKMYKLAHPDLIRSTSTEKATINDVSMQKLNGILSTMKMYNEYPAAVISELPFYFRKKPMDSCKTDLSTVVNIPKEDDDLEKFELYIKTTGGDCRRQLAVSFEHFFSKSGIHTGKFTWGDEYFPTLDKNEN